MPAKRKDHKGQKYHHLTMLRPTRSGGAGKGMYWLAQCDCGSTREVRASEASLGYVKTCGKCEYHLALVKGAGAIGGSKFKETNNQKRGLREQERKYAYSAHKRKIPWHLTPREFEEIVLKPCTYCQSSPREYKSRLNKGKGRVVSATMNGIDRIDSNKGYTFENCIPCCTTCNRMKLNLPVDVFVKQCTKVSVLFERSLKTLQEKALQEGGEDVEATDSFYLKLYRDMIAIQYGYRQTPIQTEVDEKDITAMDWKLYKLQKSVDQTPSKSRVSDKELLSHINEQLALSGGGPEIDWSTITPKMAEHAVKIVEYQVTRAKNVPSGTIHDWSKDYDNESEE